MFFLPISSLINRYCTSENPSCLEETEVRDSLQYFQQLLGYDCTPTEQVPPLKVRSKSSARPLGLSGGTKDWTQLNPLKELC